MEVAIRVDCPKSQSLLIANKIIAYAKSDKHVFCFEIAKKTKKPHIHGYFVTDKTNIDSISKWITRQPFYNGKGSYSCVKVKDTTKYKDYIFKDMNIILNTLSEEETEALIEKAAAINAEKSMKMVDKLYNYCVEFLPDYDDSINFDKDEILEKILCYYQEKAQNDDYFLMPNRTQMFQYIATIQCRLSTCEANKFNNQSFNNLKMMYKNL